MFKTSKLALCAALVSGLPAASVTESARGQCEATETNMVVASDGSFGDQFGNSVAVDGTVAVVGAPHDDDAGEQSGSTYVYLFDGADWVQQPKLTVSDASADDQCGWSVAVSGDVATFGAPTDAHAGPLSGSAYVFRFDGTNWAEETKLTPSDPSVFQLFGWSAAVDGDTAVIGAPADSQAGAAYVFRYVGNEWIEDGKITASDAAANDHFGEDVAISGNVVLVGSFEDDDAGLDSGSAYVFRYNGAVWAQEQKLVPLDLAAGDEFGRSMALDGDVAVIGARLHDESATDTGSAYVYQFDGTSWNQEQKLSASDATADDGFGSSVGISGDVVIAGADGDDPNGDGSGSAYLFKYDGSSWVEQAKLLPSNGAAFDDFGISVAIDGGVAVVGAPTAAGGASTTGAGYVYDGLSNGLPDACECPWDLDGGGVGVTDLLALLAAWGTDPGGVPDFDGNQVVDVTDLLALLAHWGDCA